MEEPPLHLVGTPAFLPALQSFARDATGLSSFPLDPVIFQSILLCLIAKEKHLVLRTPEEDVGLASRLVALTLSSLFGLSTHKLKLRDKPSQQLPTSRRGKSRSSTSTSDDPQGFLKSLFLPSSAPPHSRPYSPSSQASQDEGSAENVTSNVNKNRRHSKSSTVKHRPQRTERSRSIPNNLSAISQQTYDSRIIIPESISFQSSLPNPSDASYGFSSSSNVFASSSSSSTVMPVLRPKPVYPHESTHPHLPHAYTDPFPLPKRKRDKINRHGRSGNHAVQLPQALVISGLELTDDRVHRELASVLGEGGVVLRTTKPEEQGQGAEQVWLLPEGFIAVYVCPWHPKDRPKVHKSLLDKFAMSNNVFLTQGVRYDFRALSFSHTPSTEKPLHPHPHFFSHSNPGTPAPPTPASLPQTHTPPTFNKPLPHHQHHRERSFPPHSESQTHKLEPLLEPPITASVIAALRDAVQRTHISYDLENYLADLFSAARHHSRLESTLLTARSMRDAESLVRAARVIGADLGGGELVRTSAIAQAMADEDESVDGGKHGKHREHSIGEGLGRYHEESENQHLLASDQGLKDDALSRQASSILSSARTDSTILDVSEVDIARIVPRVLSHRVRLRDGPEDEILSSLLFGATFGPAEHDIVYQREKEWREKGGNATNATMGKVDSVKDVLVQILAEV